MYLIPIAFIFLCGINVTIMQQSKDPYTMDTSTLSYGGILNDVISLPSNDSDIASIAKFATDYAVQRHPRSMPSDESGKILPWNVEAPKKLKLQYTQDGVNPFILEEISHGPNGPRLQRRHAILGITYMFTLTWPSVPNSLRHKFIVNKDRDKQLHVNAHYYHKSVTIVPSDLGKAAHQHVVLPGGESLEASLSDPVLMTAGTCSDQSDCSPPLVAMGTETLDPSQSKPAAVDQSECSDEKGHSVWTKSKEGPETAGQSGCKKDLRMFGRLTTYNIWNYYCQYPDDKKAYMRRMAHMGKLLSESESDFIGIQEARFDQDYSWTSGPSQTAQLAKHLTNYQFVYQPATVHWHGQLRRVEEGLIIYSKHPILSHDFILLPRNMSDPEDSPHQRICLHAEVEHPALGQVQFFVAHLSLSREARERSVVEIWKYMQRFPGLAVFVGDLNAEPHEASMRFLRGEIELLGHRTEGLIDAWTVLHNEPRPDAPTIYRDDEPRDYGLTWSTLEEHLSKRIDYVYLRLTDDTKLVDVSLLDDGLRRKQAASDHVGVSAIVAPASS